MSLELHVADELIAVAKVGPDRITLKESRQVRDGEASLVIRIGRSTKRQQIILSGSNGDDGTVSYW